MLLVCVSDPLISLVPVELHVCGQRTKKDLQMVFSNTIMTKRMALLLRTTVAAVIKDQLKFCSSSQARYAPSSSCDQGSA